MAIDALNFYHRPFHDHNIVTRVHPNAYALFVASQTYVSGYNWDFVVHMVFFLNHVVYRQEMNSMNIFTIIISTNLKVTTEYYNINILPFDLYFKRIYV